jgi:hypothetical protein
MPNRFARSKRTDQIGALFLLRAVRCSVPLPICFRAEPLELRDFGRHLERFFGQGWVLECLGLKFLYVRAKCYLGQVFLSPPWGLLSGQYVLGRSCQIDHGATCTHAMYACAYLRFPARGSRVRIFGLSI